MPGPRARYENLKIELEVLQRKFEEMEAVQRRAQEGANIALNKCRLEADAYKRRLEAVEGSEGSSADLM